MKKKRKDLDRIKDFLEDMGWLFGTNNLEKKIVLKKEDKDGLLAEVTYEDDYQRMSLSIFPLFFKDKPQDQRKALLHEFCHYINHQLKIAAEDALNGKMITQDQITRANEQAASKVENLLHGLLQGIPAYAKKAYKDYLVWPETKR